MPRSLPRVALPWLALSALLVSAGVADAQAPKEKQGSPPAAASGQDAPVPSADALIVLLRTTLIALNQANLTGNYSVLRDLSSPAFQASNSDADLALIFAPLRGQRLDFSAVVTITPQLTKGPEITPQGLLHLGGSFAMQPVAVNFEMLFQWSNGSWRLFGISVNPPTGELCGQDPGRGSTQEGAGKERKRRWQEGQPVGSDTGLAFGLGAGVASEHVDRLIQPPAPGWPIRRMKGRRVAEGARLESVWAGTVSWVRIPPLRQSWPHVYGRGSTQIG